MLRTIQPTKLFCRGTGGITAFPPLVWGVLALSAREKLSIVLMLIQQPWDAQKTPDQVWPELLHDLSTLTRAAATAKIELAAEEGREDVELLWVRQRGEWRRGRLSGPRARPALKLHRAAGFAESATRLRASNLVLAVGSAPTLTD